MRVDWLKWSFLPALLVVLGVPFLFRPRAEAVDGEALRLVIITPHNEQIRTEFALGFDRWHRAHYGGRGVVIDWRTPGGTSEIRRQLFAEYEAALRRGPIRPGSMSYDLLFGGGSYEHNQMMRPITAVGPDGQPHSATVSIAVEFSAEQLHEWYGENEIGRNVLYEPGLHWFGTAVSGFGIVYNIDVLDRLGVKRPQTWEDMTDPRLVGWVALADPGQSGSIATALEVILQRLGWREGWRILRESAANTRYFADSSSKIPIDVSLGEAAMGMCIDFYGRTQAQFIRNADGSERVGYVDPPRLSDIDPDPISLLNGGPNPELAVRFIEYCLTIEGQALWDFPLAQSEGDLGPRQFELRRLPARRIMYEQYFDRLIDAVNPFELAEPIDSWDPSMRSFVAPLLGAMAIDNLDELRAAWEAMHALPADDARVAEMRRLFNAMPTVTLLDGAVVSLDSAEHLAAIRADWKLARSTEGLARGYDPLKAERDRIAWAEFFRSNYAAIVELSESSR
ncbi:MAG: extracellular solute-binding protein [Phycisphaerales bacterium]|nr:extracellular solute-binding protein [Phycisphaerales bacterium]